MRAIVSLHDLRSMMRGHRSRALSIEFTAPPSPRISIGGVGFTGSVELTEPSDPIVIQAIIDAKRVRNFLSRLRGEDGSVEIEVADNGMRWVAVVSAVIPFGVKHE